MATITVLGGDIPSGKWLFINGAMINGVTINLATSIKIVEVQTEEKLKKLSGSAGWGFAGAIIGGLAGPLGALAGLAGGVLAGGNKTEICFSCELTDGQKFIAITDVKTYQKILGYSFSSQNNQATTPAPHYIPSQETIENFKQQITETLDPKKTTYTLKTEPQGWIFTLTIKNKTRFSKEEQVELIKKAIEKTQFEGLVSIRVNKVFPNNTHTQDKEWKTILNYNNKQITEVNPDLPKILVYVILGFVILVFISDFISDIFKNIQKTTVPKPTVTETNRTPSSSRTYIGTSPSGSHYSLWKEGTCIVVTGLTEGDLRRLNTDLSGFKQVIKDETGTQCVLIE